MFQTTNQRSSCFFVRSEFVAASQTAPIFLGAEWDHVWAGMGHEKFPSKWQHSRFKHQKSQYFGNMAILTSKLKRKWYNVNIIEYNDNIMKNHLPRSVLGLQPQGGVGAGVGKLAHPVGWCGLLDPPRHHTNLPNPGGRQCRSTTVQSGSSTPTSCPQPLPARNAPTPTPATPTATPTATAIATTADILSGLLSLLWLSPPQLFHLSILSKVWLLSFLRWFSPLSPHHIPLDEQLIFSPYLIFIQQAEYGKPG